MEILEYKCLLVKVKEQSTVENILKHIRTILESAKERKGRLYFIFQSLIIFILIC